MSLFSQGNLDPSILYGPDHIIKERTEAILKMGGWVYVCACLLRGRGLCACLLVFATLCLAHEEGGEEEQWSRRCGEPGVAFARGRAQIVD